MSAIRVASGHLFLFFAYDVGFYVSLPDAGPLCGAGQSAGVAGLRPVPPHLQYHPRPLTVPCGTVEVAAGGAAARMTSFAKIFDFGALSITMCLPVADLSWGQYMETALLLSGDGGAEVEAREIALRLFEEIRPAVTRPGFTDIVEEYGVWHVGSFSPALTGADALDRLAPDLARLLTLERGTLSGAAAAEVLRNPIRYFDNDLVLPEWNAAFVYDPKFQDTLEVLEFLNVQMLELRFFDRILHAAIDEMGEELPRKRRRFPVLWDPYDRPLRKLSEIKVDVSLVQERIHNTLKLVGDVYLARVHEEARRRAGAEKWEGTIRDQLKVLEDIYTILNNRAAAARTETLEMIIVLLIALEIVMGILRW